MQQAEATRLLGDVAVRDLLQPSTTAVRADEPVSKAVDRVFRLYDADSVAVQPAGDDRVVGVLTIDQVRGVAREDRSHVAVQDVMGPVENLASVDVDEGNTRVLDALRPKAPGVVATQSGGPSA